MYKLITREQARARGRKTYYTGEICKRDHVTERYTSNGVCVECKKIEARLNRLKRKEITNATFEQSTS